jgi:hypothetical protein
MADPSAETAHASTEGGLRRCRRLILIAITPSRQARRPNDDNKFQPGTFR